MTLEIPTHLVKRARVLGMPEAVLKQAIVIGLAKIEADKQLDEYEKERDAT